jgi:hypothetical protein
MKMMMMDDDDDDDDDDDGRNPQGCCTKSIKRAQLGFCRAVERAGHQQRSNRKIEGKRRP